MAPKNNTEALDIKVPATSETLKVGAIPETFELPQEDERFLIGVESTEEQGEDPKGGFEVVSLAECARNEKGKITYEYPVTDSEGNIRLESARFSGTIVAFLMKNGETPDFASGKGFKGLREGELVSDGVIKERFGENSTSFSVGITEGKIIVENTRPETELRVTTEKEAAEVMPETQAPVVEQEANSERAKVAGELGEEVLDLIGVNEPNDEVDVETKPRPTIAEMMRGEAGSVPEVAIEAPAVEVATEITEEAPAVEAIATPEVSEQVVSQEAETEVAPVEAVAAEPTPEVAVVNSELGTATEELEVFEKKMGETKAALEQLIDGQYSNFKDINAGLDELFKDKTGQEADLPSLLRGNMAKLSTYVREIDAGQGDVNTLREVATILSGIRQATSHLQGGNSPLVTLPQLIEASNGKIQMLAEGTSDAARGMMQATTRMYETLNPDNDSPDRGQYDVKVQQSRADIMSLINEVEDNEGPIVGALRTTSSIDENVTIARSQYYTMSSLIDGVLGQMGARGVNSEDLYAIQHIIAQFEGSFDQLEQNKRALTGIIPPSPEQ